MPITNLAFWMLVVLALAIAGVLTVLDEILSDTPYTEPLSTELVPHGGPESKNTERRSGSECRT
jgi:hypothetical protein